MKVIVSIYSKLGVSGIAMLTKSCKKKCPHFGKQMASNSESTKLVRGTSSELRKRMGGKKIAIKLQLIIRKYHLMFVYIET